MASGYACGPESQAALSLERVLAEDPIHSTSERKLAFAACDESHCEMWQTERSSIADLIPRLDFPKDQQRFRDECIHGNRPAVINGVAQSCNWQAVSWIENIDVLMAEHGQLEFELKKTGVNMSLEDYVEYSSSNTADFPFYLVSRGKSGIHDQLMNDFSVPEWFADDVYDWVEMGGSFRYFLCGGQRSGTNLHVDPLGTCAWNTSFCGHKRWVLLPPGDDPQYKALLGASEESYKTPPAYWFTDIYPKLKNSQEELGMLEYIQMPGETMFVPAGWWHIVLNLDLTVAVTMNHMLPLMLPTALNEFDRTSPMFGRMLRQELKQLQGDKQQLVQQALQASQ